jgi:hypothetical protein
VRRVKSFRWVAIGWASSVLSPVALADDANTVLTRGTTFLKNLATFGLLAFAVVGVFLVGAAFLEIQRLRQTQEPLGRPITKLLIGAALASLSVLIGIISGTFVTTSSQQSDLNLG